MVFIFYVVFHCLMYALYDWDILFDVWNIFFCRVHIFFSLLLNAYQLILWTY